MRTLLSLLFLTVFLHASAQNGDMEHILVEKMVKSINELKSLQCDIVARERINGKLKEVQPFMKVSFQPYHIYIKLKSNGSELLWKEDENGKKALVNPNGFPYVNLDLDPYGYFMRSNNHHTIYEIGFKYFGEIMRKELQRNGDKFYDVTTYSGTVKWNNKEYYLVEVLHNDFGYYDYKAGKNENLIQIARKLNVAEHMIKEKNNLSDYGVVKEGTVLKVPNHYAKRIVLYIDKSLYLPMYQRMEDDEGVYELYEYSNFIANPSFSKEDFSRDNPGYGF